MPEGRLTQGDRQRIATGLEDGLAYAEIARRLERPTSTITREVMRNGGPAGYRADLAQRASRVRAQRRKTAVVAVPADPPPADGSGRDPNTVHELVERFTALLVQSGLPRMAGGVLACLYVTDSGSLTSGELVQRLRVSPASISKAIGYLEEQELVRRERDPQRRAERYVIDRDIWYKAMIASARANAEIAAAARESAEILGPATPAGERLAQTADFLLQTGNDLVRSAERWLRPHQ